MTHNHALNYLSVTQITGSTIREDLESKETKHFCNSIAKCQVALSHLRPQYPTSCYAVIGMFMHWYILNYLIEREMINEQLMQWPHAKINKWETTTSKESLIITCRKRVYAHSRFAAFLWKFKSFPVVDCLE